MNLTNKAPKKIRIIFCFFWVLVSVILAVFHTIINGMSDNFLLLVFALYIAIIIANLTRLAERFGNDSYFDLISWSVFQSAILVLAAFATEFPYEDRGVFWMGIGAVIVLYATTRLGSVWLSRRFKNIV